MELRVKNRIIKPLIALSALYASVAIGARRPSATATMQDPQEQLPSRGPRLDAKAPTQSPDSYLPNIKMGESVESGNEIAKILGLDSIKSLTELGSHLRQASDVNLHVGWSDMDDQVDKIQNAIAKMGDLLVALDLVQKDLTDGLKDPEGKEITIGQISTCLSMPSALLRLSGDKLEQGITILTKKEPDLKKREKLATSYRKACTLGCKTKQCCAGLAVRRLKKLLQALVVDTLLEIEYKTKEGETKKAKALLDGALEMAQSISKAIPGGDFTLNIKDINDQIEPVRRVIKSVLNILNLLENLTAKIQQNAKEGAK